LDISNLIQERFRIHHNTIANDGHRFVVYNSGRDEMEFESNTVDNDGVASIVAAVEADHVVRFTGKEIGDLSFALVTPLGADNCSYVRRVGRHSVPRAGLVEWR